MRHRPLLLSIIVLVGVAVVGGALIAWSNDDSSSSSRKAAPASGRVSANGDQAGERSRIHWSRRIDAGLAEEDLQPFLEAARDTTRSQFPQQTVQLDRSAYGRSSWGQCLGQDEATVTRDREGWEWMEEGCEKSGIRVLSLPIAQDVWLLVNSRASMRPEVEYYVNETLDRAIETAEEAGITPLTDDELSDSKSHYAQFVERERTAGTVPMVG